MPTPLVARVRVPASTSNLGPGFDLLGLALDLYLDVSVRLEGTGPPAFEQLGGEASDWPAPPANLLCRTLREERGSDVGLVYTVHSEIPVGRGLGSSAAAVVAGALLADALEDRQRDRSRLFRTCLPYESHPDNLAPALFGGLQLCVPDGPALACPFHPSLQLAVAWPRTPMSTQSARAALPAEVPHADAVRNAGRLCALLEGLRTGDPELIRLGGQDLLHEPFRIPLVRGAQTSLDGARAAGALLATLSGSGSALFAVAPEAAIDGVLAALADGLEAAGEAVQARRVQIDPTGARVIA